MEQHMEGTCPEVIELDHSRRIRFKWDERRHRVEMRQETHEHKHEIVSLTRASAATLAIALLVWSASLADAEGSH